MKILVERDPFAEAISAAMRAAKNGPDIPILGNVLLRPNGSALSVAGTNLDVRFETEVAAEIEGDSSKAAITVVGDALVGIIARLPKGAQVAMEWDETMATADRASPATVKSGKSRYKLNTLPATHFPELPMPEESISFAMPAKALVEALSVTRFAMSKDHSRFYLAGIYWHQATDEHAVFGNSRAKRMAFCATSGFELARRTVDVPRGSEQMSNVIIPAPAIGEIIRLLTDAEGDVNVRSSKTLYSFEHGGNVFTTKLIDGTFPDYMRAIPDTNDKTVIIDASALAEALTRLNVMTDKQGGVCELSNGQIKLSIVNADSGEAEEILECEYEGEELRLGIRGAGFLSILDAANCDVCQIKFGTPSHPIIINPMGGAIPDYTRTFVSMPMVV